MKKEGSLANGFRLYGFSLLLVQLLAACSPTKEQALPAADNGAANMTAKATQPIADGKLVVVFGDSLYAGYNLQQDQGFAPILEQALSKQGIKAHVVNAGVSGDTSADGLARLAFGLDGLSRKPDLVLVGLGGNDMLRGLSPQATRTNIDAILTELTKRGIPAMLTGMMASPNMGPDYAAAFNPIYPDLAKKHGVPLYPFFLDGVIGERSLLLPDGIHPNAQGVQRITAKVAPSVATQLGK